MKPNRFIFYVTHAFTLNLTEVITPVDTITKITSRTLSETLTLVDTVLKSLARTFIETIVIVDTIVKTTTKVLTEAVALVDKINWSVPFVVSSATNSGLSTTPSVSMPERAHPGDLLVVLVSKNGDATSVDNNGATPMTEDGDYNGFTGGNGIAIYTRKLTGAEGSTLNFTLASSQRWATIAFLVRDWHGTTIYDVSPSNGVSTGTAPSVINCATATTNTNNALAIAVANIDGIANGSFDTPAAPSGWNDITRINAQQPMAAAYKLIKVAGSTGAVDLEVTMSAGNGAGLNIFSIRSTGLFTTTLSETITLVDSVIKSLAKTITETVTVVDTVVKAISRTFVESVSLTDTIVRVISRTLTESIVLVDTVVKVMSRTFQEAVSVTDTIERVISKVLTETLTLVDTIENVLTSASAGIKKGFTILLTKTKKAITTIRSRKVIIRTRTKDKTVL